MTKPTLQQAYDRIVRSAFDGTFPSVVSLAVFYNEGRCRYRLDKTPTCKQRCVAGLFLPDEAYTEHMEGESVRSQLIFPKLILPDEIDKKDMMTLLQNLHDREALAPTGWNAQEFVRKVNELSVFRSVTHVDPTTYHVEVST